MTRLADWKSTAPTPKPTLRPPGIIISSKLKELKNCIFLPVLVLIAALGTATAQQIPGLHYSNYGGLYRATYNPSVIGGSHYKWQINIGSLGGSINNRYFRLLGKNSLLYPQLAAHSTKELYGRSRTMGSLIQQNPVYLASEIRWPSVMFSLGQNHGIAFQVRSRGFVVGKNIPSAIQNLYFKRLDTGSTPDVVNEPWGDFNLVQQSFSEAGISYGLALINAQSHKLKVGGTLKRIFGARTGYLDATADHFTIRGVGAETSEWIVNNFSYESGYSHQVEKMKVGNLFDSSKYGSGWGIDLGVSYELGSYWARGKEAFDQSPEYIVRLGASVTDVGSIRYQTKNSRVVRGSQAQTIIDQTWLETVSDRGPEGLMSLLPASIDTSFAKTVMLPKAIHLEADFQLVKGFFLNVSRTALLNTRVNENLDIMIPNSFTITPRFEDEDSDIAFPISFIEGNKKATIGVTGHLGPIFVGISDLRSLMKRSGGSMVYIGISVWKLRRPNKDGLFKSSKK
jgi:hypothetical protein